jgi:hypothetical protein
MKNQIGNKILDRIILDEKVLGYSLFNKCECNHFDFKELIYLM